jgi:hypothetical protein
MAKIDTGLEKDTIIALVVMTGRKGRDGLLYIWSIVSIYHVLQEGQVGRPGMPYVDKKSLASRRHKPYVSPGMGVIS